MGLLYIGRREEVIISTYGKQVGDHNLKGLALSEKRALLYCPVSVNV